MIPFSSFLRTALLLLSLSFFLSPLAPTSLLQSSDEFQFGYLWPEIKEYAEQGTLYEMILKRREEIDTTKHHWSQKMDALEKKELLEPLILNTLCFGQLMLAQEGTGGTYFLLDAYKRPCFVIKPFDEDILCLNNPRHYSNPLSNPKFRVRPDIPLYSSTQRDIAAVKTAKLLNLEHITPEATMMLIESEMFYDITDCLPHPEKSLFQQVGYPDRKKLCSVQVYIPHIKDLFELINEWTQKKISLSTASLLIDQDDFEEANIFIWVIYDNDAHSGNILIYPKTVDYSLTPIFGLKKIDNSLSFPEKNTFLINALKDLPNSQLPLSKTARQKITAIPIDQIIEVLNEYELSNSIEAFLSRIKVLQHLVKKEELTIAQIDYRLSLLNLPNGEELALNLPFEEVELKSNLLNSTPLQLREFFFE